MFEDEYDYPSKYYSRYDLDNFYEEKGVVIPPVVVPSIRPIAYIGFTSKRRYGVELEMNKHIGQLAIKNVISTVDQTRPVNVTSWSHSRGNNYWHVKTDSTCGDKGHGKDDGGWEVASFVAKGCNDLRTIGNVVKALQEIGAEVNANCGFHIHADVSTSRSTDSILNLVKNWLRIEQIIYQMVPANRRDNIYCMPLRSKLRLAKSVNITNDSLSVKIHDYINNYNDRRVSFNVWNYFYGDIRTVELRLPEGTLNHHTVKHWVRMFVHFVSNSSKSGDITDNICPVNLEDTLNILGLCGKEKFYILSKHLLSTKIWFLKRILKYSNDLLLIEEAKKMLVNIT